jgi:hypothetical protein
MNCSACDSPLLASFDFTNESTWSPLTYDITSENPIPDAEVGSLTVSTYGQTAVDNGEALLWTDKLVIAGEKERKMTLKRLAKLMPQGNDTGLAVILEPVLLGFGNFVETILGEKYLHLSGAGLSNFFKVEGKPYQVLPYRYENGFSMETAIYMAATDFDAMPNWEDGVFFYMGTRAENKFSDALHPELELVKKDDPQLVLPTHTGIESNGIALRVGNDGSLSFRYIDGAGVVQSVSTKAGAIKPGWSVVLLTFLPTGKLGDGQITPTDDDVLRCAPVRPGKLALYVNGKMVLSECEFPEFFCKPFEKDEEPKPYAPTYKQTLLPAAPAKQAGVTYTLSWGGGVTGLKNAFQYNHKTKALEPQERFAGLTIEKNFGGIFQGGIQYMKIWGEALTFFDARENFNLKAKGYGLFPIQGGRIIRSN